MGKSAEHKVLYLTYDGLSDHIGQSQILPYLLACKERGIDIGIISCEKANKKDKAEKIAALLKEQGIEWQRINFSEGGNLSKLVDFLKFVSTAFNVARKEKYTVIHSRSYFASSVGLLLKTFLSKKLIFDKRDFWIDAKIETGRLETSMLSHRIIHSFLRFFERRLFLRSDHIISLTERAKQIVLQKYPSRKPDDITVIPCCVDLSLFDPTHIKSEESGNLKERLGLDGAFVLGYVGSIGPAYMIPELLECFQVISNEIGNAKLLMLVNNDKEEVYKIARERNVDVKGIIISTAPRDEMPKYISVFDCGIYFITPTYAKQATSPTKLSEILAMQKPVITNKNVGDAEKIFDELECGYLISGFNKEEYAQATRWLKKHKRSWTFDLSNYSLRYGVEQYYSVYKKLL